VGDQRQRGVSGTANWTGGVPGNTGDTAIFGAALTGGTATVTLDSSRSLSSLAFSTTGGASYVISPSNGSTLTIANTAGSATIGDSGGNHTIAAPIILGSNLSVSVSGGNSLTIAGGISQSGSSCSVNVGGGGELILSNTNTYTGGTIVNSGTMAVAGASALPSAGVLVVGRSGRVVLGASDGIGALLTASSPVGSDGVAPSTATSVPPTIESMSGNTSTLGDDPSLLADGAGDTAGGTAASVPEPSTALLAISGLLAIAAARGRLTGK
jgi:autotransporter-associated beta strand protein